MIIDFIDFIDFLKLMIIILAISVKLFRKTSSLSRFDDALHRDSRMRDHKIPEAATRTRAFGRKCWVIIGALAIHERHNDRCLTENLF